jgi:hypothetical protein
MFDLWNEPVHPDDFTLYGSTPNPLWPELKLAYESLIQTVRTNGGQNIVIATGNRWASWLVGIKDNPLADAKVVYAYHKYSVEGSNTATEWNRDTGGLIGVKPVMVTEWGFEDTDVTGPTWPGSQASYGDPFTQWLESNHLSNLAWMYHHDWTPALFQSNGSLTIYGNFVKGYLATTNSSNKPDLIITNVTINPISPEADQTFEISITIKNQGSASVTNNVYRDVYIDRDPSALLDPITGCPPPGDFFRFDSYSSLAPGMSDTKIVTITGGLPSGDHQLWFYVDARCLVDEGGGNNNAP